MTKSSFYPLSRLRILPRILLSVFICLVFSLEGSGYSFPDTTCKACLRKPMAFEKGSSDASRVKGTMPPEVSNPLPNNTHGWQVTGNTYWIKDKSTRRRIVRLACTIGQSIQDRYRVLEMGIGSGLLTGKLVEEVAHKGYTGIKFFGTDIEPSAVEDAKSNLKKSKNVKIFGPGDLFSTLKDNLRFHVIFWNPPWYPQVIQSYQRAMVDPDHKTLRRFFESAPLHLTKDGKIFIIFPCRQDKTLQGLAQDYSFSFRKTSEEHGLGLYEFRPTRQDRALKTRLESIAPNNYI